LLGVHADDRLQQVDRFSVRPRINVAAALGEPRRKGGVARGRSDVTGLHDNESPIAVQRRQEGCASASSSATRTLQLHATITDFTALPARPDTEAQQPGDQFLYIAQLTNAGKPAGLSPHHCAAITADYTLCDAVANLADGQVTFQTALGGKNVLPVVKVAITGGTGKYRDAHGQLTITANADGSQDWQLDFD